VTQGQQQHGGLMAVDRAFNRLVYVTGFACLSGAILEVVGYQSAAPAAPMWPALLLLAITLALLIYLERRRTRYYTVLFLILGGASQYWLSVALLSAFPSVRVNPTLILSLASVSLVLVRGPGRLLRSTIVWGTAGFIIGQAASLGAALITGSPFRLDVIASTVEVGLVLVELTDALTRSRRLAVRPELDRAVLDDELSVLRYRTEVRAAALMHDTVLGHLSAIAAGPDGALSPHLRSEIERDLIVLNREDWLIDPAPVIDDPTRSVWRRSALLAAVQEARELSLIVDVTGDPAAIGQLTLERDVAVGLAVKQCLVNVLRHAQVSRAEVVVIGSDSDVSVMVIDAGRGFSEEFVASDRLGLRQSVRRRIESVGGEVQLWSTPGRGTSVLIRVPAARASGVPDE
jgi:signal transduction histidine kinase